MSDAACWPDLLVGFDGIEVLDVERVDGLVVVTFETTDTQMWCAERGGQARVKDRTDVTLVDLAVFGHSLAAGVAQTPLEMPQPRVHSTIRN